MVPHQIKAANILTVSRIVVAGTINERFRWSDLKWYSQGFLKPLPAPQQEGLKALLPNLQIYLQDVAFINSTGIKKFRDVHNDIFAGRRSVELHEVSYEFLRDAMFLAPEVHEGCRVKSLQIPYQCASCQDLQDVLIFDYEVLDNTALEKKIESTYPCQNQSCKGSATLVNKTGRYFWTTLRGIIED